jgi:hypothetical protein
MRDRLMRGMVTLGALVWLCALALAPAAQASASVTFGTPQLIGGGIQLESIACASASSCYAVGNSAATDSGRTDTTSEVIPITNGVPGTPVPVPDPSSVTPGHSLVLRDIVCPSSTTCYADGNFSPGYTSPPESGGGAVVTIINGTPSQPEIITSSSAADPGPDDVLGLNGISCWSASGCEVVGSLDTSTTGSDVYGVAAPVTNGMPGPVSTDSNAYGFGSIECSAAGTCDIFGTDSNQDGLLVSLSGGNFTAQADSAVTGGATFACYSTASCLILPVFGGFYQTLTNGTTIGPQVDSTVGYFGSCPTTTVCWTVGGTPAGQTVIEPILSGVAQATTASNVGPLDGVVCTSATSCLALDTPQNTGSWGIISITGTISTSTSSSGSSTGSGSDGGTGSGSTSGTDMNPQLTVTKPTQKDGIASVAIHCAEATCDIKLTETIRVKHGKKSELETIASKTVTLAAGKHAVEALKLNRVGAKSLRKANRKRLKATITITLAGKRVSTKTLTLGEHLPERA